MHRDAKELGVQGALVSICLYYNRPSAEGCFLHFEEVAKVGLPLILYHNPARTGVHLLSTHLARIDHLPNVVGIKDSSGSLDYVKELMQKTEVPNSLWG